MLVGKYGQTRLALSICQAKTTLLELFNIHFMNRTLTSAFIPNFSQIGELKWLQSFEKVQKLQTISLKRLRVTSFANKILCFGNDYHQSYPEGGEG